MKSPEDKFQELAESVENALKLELKKRRQRKLRNMIITALVVAAAIVVGLAAK